MEWFYLAYDSENWRTLLSTVKNFRGP